MPTKAERSPSDRIAASFKQLSESALHLNAASDELGKAIAPIDAALKKLNLGVGTWHKYDETEYEDGSFCHHLIGYAKVAGKWGLAIAELTGNPSYGFDDPTEWLFNDAPRSMRIEAIDHLPDLLEALVTGANKVTTILQDKAKQTRELAATLTALSALPTSPR